MSMSIDACYENVIATLSKQDKIKAISQKILSLTTNEDRVLYVYDILENLDAFPKPLEVTKTDNVSTLYRNHGNQCYQKKEDYKAWQFYNLSLLHAPASSDAYCLALSNRSAVFYSIKKYKECWQDIKKVFSMRYPPNLGEKLVRRQMLCEEYISQEQECSSKSADMEIEKLLIFQDPKQNRYPCASTKLEVVNSEAMGRHVIAKEDIKAGDILAQESPYFTLLLKSQYLFSCNYCLGRSLNLLPCPQCCFVLYCSTQCKYKAWKEYHSVECKLMPTLIQMEFTKLELLALRTVLKARSDHSDWEGLYKTIEEAEENMSSEYRGHVKVNGEWVYDSKYYPSIHTLSTNIEKRSISDIFQKSVTAAVLLNLLSNKTNFLKLENENDALKARKCVAGTLLLHIMTSPTNMHGLSTNIQTKENGHYIDEVGYASAPYAFHSLLNHSCAPNVVRFGKLGTNLMTLYALRPIKKGMQLFDNYGSHHAIHDRNKRQEALKFQYKFTCLCEACVNDWPTYFNMKPKKQIPRALRQKKENLIDSSAIENLQNGDKDTALRLFKPLCELIDLLDKYAPCPELSDCQETLKQCLIIFRGVIPYGFCNMVEWQAVTLPT